MTTPNTDLAEQIARALRRHDAETHGWSGPMLLTMTAQDYMPAAAAVLPIVDAAVKRGQAEAWAKGWDAASTPDGYAWDGEQDVPVAPSYWNPYKETPDEQ